MTERGGGGQREKEKMGMEDSAEGLDLMPSIQNLFR